MPWNVLFHDDFHVEFQAMGSTLQDELLAHARLLQEFGPHLGRPTVDTLKSSKHANMGASKNSEFAQMQGAEKNSSRRIWIICKQEIFSATQQLG